MSWPAVAWSLGQRAPSSAAKFLLVVIADSASAGDWLAWPSVAYLSDTTQQDRKTVLRNLKGLAELGLIEDAGRTGKTKQVTIWRLPVPSPGQADKGPKSGTLGAIETVPLFPSKSPKFPSKESQKRDTEPVRNPKGTRESSGSRLPADWTLPLEWRQWARERRPDLDVDAVAESFADYWRARPGRDGVKADWFATWRNWVRRENTAARAIAAPPTRRPVLDSDDNLAEAAR